MCAEGEIRFRSDLDHIWGWLIDDPSLQRSAYAHLAATPGTIKCANR